MDLAGRSRRGRFASPGEIRTADHRQTHRGGRQWSAVTRVAAYLHKKGARIALVAEQAPWHNLARFALQLAAHPGKLMQALALKFQLRQVPQRTGCWPVAARGQEQLAGVTLTDGQKTWEVACDYLACGFGLVPNAELPVLLGCALHGGVVQVDDWQETTVPGVYCAGEATGIGGLERSLVEGRIAGHAAAGNRSAAGRLFSERRRAALRGGPGRDLCPATGTPATAATGNCGVPVRGRDLGPADAVCNLAGGQVADALWHGAVPGPDLWASPGVSSRLRQRRRATAGLSRTSRQPTIISTNLRKYGSRSS